jgi:hypothetical protein
LTALSTVMNAAQSGSWILWFGVFVLAGVAIVFAKAKSIFRHDNAHRGNLAQLIAVAVTVGSLLVYFKVETSQGTQRGRIAFVEEVKQGYVKAGITTVEVYIEGRALVIKGETDTDEQIDEAARGMEVQLRSHGRNAKAWVLGFRNIKITNGRHTRFIAPEH